MSKDSLQLRVALGNSSKPPIIAFLEDAVWRAIIKVSIGVTPEAAIDEFKHIYMSHETQGSLGQDRAARDWFKEYRSTFMSV